MYSRFHSDFIGESRISIIAYQIEVSLTNESRNKNKMTAPSIWETPAIEVVDNDNVCPSIM